MPAKADASGATDEVNPGSTTNRAAYPRWRIHLLKGRNQTKPVLYVFSLTRMRSESGMTLKEGLR